jgi:hypothetical protein
MGIFIIALAIVSVALIPSLIPNKPANAQGNPCDRGDKSPDWVDACKQGRNDQMSGRRYDSSVVPQDGYYAGWCSILCRR